MLRAAASTTLLSIVALNVTLPEPLNDIAPAVISPVIEKFLEFCKVVAEPAFPETVPVTLPVTGPLNLVASISLFDTNLPFA